MAVPPARYLYAPIVARALAEDLEHGDITTALTVDTSLSGEAFIVAKEPCVCAGMFMLKEVFGQVDETLDTVFEVQDGSRQEQGAIIARIKGPVSSILQGERVALNFLQRLFGIATLTAKIVDTVKGFSCVVCDTRKTTPGMRLLEKYAVTAGGGSNHRFSLSDGILIKDNHIAACGGVGNAVRKAKIGSPHCLKVEVEISQIEQLEPALEEGADILLLDNMNVHELKKAVNMARGIKKGVLIEASGNVNLENIEKIAETGVDIISSGVLTHSFKSIDLSLSLQIPG